MKLWQNSIAWPHSHVFAYAQKISTLLNKQLVDFVSLVSWTGVRRMIITSLMWYVLLFCVLNICKLWKPMSAKPHSVQYVPIEPLLHSKCLDLAPFEVIFFETVLSIRFTSQWKCHQSTLVIRGGFKCVYSRFSEECNFHKCEIQSN